MAEPTTVINVRIPKRVHEGLKREAIRRRSSVSAIVAEAADRVVAEAAPVQSVYDALGDFIGCLSFPTDGGYSSADVDKVFVEGLRKKHREGHL